MVVIGDIGIEIRPPSFDHDLPEQPSGAKLVQRVVDGGQRNRYALGFRLSMQLFGGDMAIASLEQDLSQQQALPRRTQARAVKDGYRHFARSIFGASHQSSISPPGARRPHVSKHQRSSSLVK
jgi:hypothetical protein